MAMLPVEEFELSVGLCYKRTSSQFKLPNTGFVLRNVSNLLFSAEEGTTSQLMLPNTGFLLRNVSNLLFCENVWGPPGGSCCLIQVSC